MLKILGKMDVSDYKKVPRFETSKNVFDSFLGKYAQKINGEFSGFLSSDGSIDFNHRDYDQERLALDKEIISQKENYWSGGDLEWYYKTREKNPSLVAEKAIASLLVKMIGEDFIIARASKYDDYENGVDHVLIDRRSGAVICGLDEVLGHQGDDGGKKKNPKIDKIYQRQGLNLRYGATLENGVLKRKSFKHLPAFYVSLSKEELTSLCQNFREDEVNLEEKKIFSKIISSLEEQYNSLEDNNFHPELELNLNNFEKSLEKIKKASSCLL